MSQVQNNGTNNVGAARSILDVQQQFAESLGYGREIIWDLLSFNQADLLHEKLKALIPDPRVPSNLTGDDRKAALKKLPKQLDECKRIRETIFTSVWGQRKYTNRQSLTSIFYAMVATDETDLEAAENSRSWSCHPVFRTRRCISDNDGSSNNSSNCCLIYVDEHGRVYQNWSSFLSKNELPKGIVVVPWNGIYKLDSNGKVMLEACVTPAGTTSRKVLGVLDTSTAMAGFGAACVPIVGLFCTVAAPVMLVAGGVGLAAASYTTARSGAQLIDRSQHEQSINVTDRSARNHWISGLAGAVSLGAAGATSAVTAATNAGREVGLVAQMTVNGMNISSIMISGTGLANGAMDLFLKYQDGDDISTLDVLQLSTSLVLFTHGVCNFKLASTIINDTANNRIGSYRETLSNRQRRMFDKTYKETFRTGGNKMDIIRNVNEIPSRQQFNDLYKINKNLNQRGVRPSFGANGKIMLNNQVATNTAELRASVQHNTGSDILGRVTNPIPKNSAAFSGTGRTLNGAIPMPSVTGSSATSLDTNDGGNTELEIRLLSLVMNGVTITLKKYGKHLFDRIVDGESFRTTLLSLADNLRIEFMEFVLDTLETFMDCMWEKLNMSLKFYISTESVLFRIGCIILNEYRECSLEYIRDHLIEILQSVYDYFMSLNPNVSPDLLTKCEICSGYYSICEL